MRQLYVHTSGGGGDTQSSITADPVRAGISRRSSFSFDVNVNEADGIGRGKSANMHLASADAADGGRRGDCWFCLWLLAGVVLLLALVNATLSMLVVGVLRVGAGMQQLQVTGHSSVFSGVVDLGRVLKADGQVLGLDGEGFVVVGDGGGVDISADSIGSGIDGRSGLVDSTTGARVSLSHDAVTVRSRGASISSPVASTARDSGGAKNTGADTLRGSTAARRCFFDTRFPNFGLPAGVRSVRVRAAHTRRVTSAAGRPLRLLASTQTHVRGSEGVAVRGAAVTLSADRELHVASVNGSVVLDGQVSVDVRQLPWTDGRVGSKDSGGGDDTGGRVDVQAYLLCVCAGDGRLFRVTSSSASCDVTPSPCVN